MAELLSDKNIKLQNLTNNRDYVIHELIEVAKQLKGTKEYLEKTIKMIQTLT